MKKIIVFLATTIVLVLTINVTAKAQNIFECRKLDVDYNRVVTYKKAFNGRLKAWATRLAKDFPVDDNNCISYESIITYPDSLDIQMIMDKTIEWSHYQYSSSDAIKRIERGSGSESILITATLGKVGSLSSVDLFYAKVAEIRADIEVLIRFREGRLKIKTLVRHYNYSSGDSMLNGKSIMVSPGEVYPVNDDIPDIKGLVDRTVCYLAFINSTAHVIETCADYKKFLEKEFAKIGTSDGDNW